MDKYISDILLKLISERTVNYNPIDYPEHGPDFMASPGEEYKIIKLIKKELDKIKVSYTVYNGEQRPDLIATIGKSLPGYRKILLSVHMDTVPSGNDPWQKSAPFEPKMIGSKIYGRGAADDKGPLASLLAAAITLKKIEKKIMGQVIISFNSDEEVNLCPGLQNLIKSGKIKPTDAIIPDVGRSMKEIVIGEKGRLVISVKSIGKAAHASRPHLGRNAILVMSSFAVLLSRYKLKHKPNHLFPDGPTINVGIMKGGDAPNIVPAICEMLIDVRYLPGQSPEKIIRELKKLSAKAGGQFAFEIRTNNNPHVVPKDAEIIRIIRKHSKAKLTGIGGGTVSKILYAHGINAVGFAPGNEKVMHSADEYIDIGELTRFADKICSIAIDAANTKSA